jgi:polysaccharide pyruvyl transferase WcaK-like protein
MNATFSGFYGMNNTGDDCFCKIAEWGAEEYWQVKRSYFLSSQIPELSQNSQKVLMKAPHRLSFINDFLLHRHFSKNNLLIYAGGSIFHGIEWREMQFAKENYHKYNLKIGAIGVSVGPFSSVKNERDIVEFLKRMSFVSVRDQSSYDLVQSYNIDTPCINAFDLAGLLPRVQGNNNRNRKSSTRKIIGLALCSFNGKSGTTHHENHSRLQLVARLGITN